MTPSSDDLTSLQRDILSLLANGETWTAARVAVALGWNKSSVRVQMGRLRKRGFLEHVPEVAGARYSIAGFRRIVGERP